MPEGDTIHRTAAALRTAVLGKPLTAFEAPRLTGMRPTIGAVIERVESRGKHLEIGFDDGVVLHTHMRMTGSWHLYRAGEQWRKSTRQARVIIEVPGWQAVCFSAPVVRTYRAREFVPNPHLAQLGPDLCTADADLEECVARIDRFLEQETTVAEVLLDQRISCGVGNVYKSEVLWLCELHPSSPIGGLLPEQRLVLLSTAAQLLRSNLDRPNRVTVPGVPGGVAVYGRHKKPCFRCGTTVEVSKHGEQARVTYWCPGCQLFLPLPGAEPEVPDEWAEPLAEPNRAASNGWVEEPVERYDLEEPRQSNGHVVLFDIEEPHHEEAQVELYDVEEVEREDPRPTFFDPLLARTDDR
jgi:endonuclease-8